MSQGLRQAVEKNPHRRCVHPLGHLNIVLGAQPQRGIEALKPLPHKRHFAFTAHDIRQEIIDVHSAHLERYLLLARRRHVPQRGIELHLPQRPAVPHRQDAGSSSSRPVKRRTRSGGG